MTSYFDALETRTPAQRESQLLAALPRQVAHAQRASAAFAQILAGIDAQAVATRADLARLPVTRKPELFERQKAGRPQDLFGGFATLRRGPAMPRIFSSPGPVYEPESASRDYWRAGRALYAAGFRAGDLVHNAFSYHMTPGAFIMESGAHAVGCTVFPAGVGQTEQQLQAIAELRPDAYVGTPSFLRILLEKAQAEGTDASSLRKGLTGGEALPPTLRDWFGWSDPIAALRDRPRTIAVTHGAAGSTLHGGAGQTSGQSIEIPGTAAAPGGDNVGCGKDHTLFALKDGTVLFTIKGEKKRRTVVIVPAAE